MMFLLGLLIGCAFAAIVLHIHNEARNFALAGQIHQIADAVEEDRPISVHAIRELADVVMDGGSKCPE